MDRAQEQAAEAERAGRAAAERAAQMRREGEAAAAQGKSSDPTAKAAAAAKRAGALFVLSWRVSVMACAPLHSVHGGVTGC